MFKLLFKDCEKSLSVMVEGIHDHFPDQQSDKRCYFAEVRYRSRNAFPRLSGTSNMSTGRVKDLGSVLPD